LFGCAQARDTLHVPGAGCPDRPRCHGRRVAGPRLGVAGQIGAAGPSQPAVRQARAHGRRAHVTGPALPDCRAPVDAEGVTGFVGHAGRSGGTGGGGAVLGAGSSCPVGWAGGSLFGCAQARDTFHVPGAGCPDRPRRHGRRVAGPHLGVAGQIGAAGPAEPAVGQTRVHRRRAHVAGPALTAARTRVDTECTPGFVRHAGRSGGTCRSRAVLRAGAAGPVRRARGP
jgi:hypothetical protein